jgi:hypothetical protein
MAIEDILVGGLVSGLVSITVAGIAFIAATRNINKSTYVAAITNERAKWREELRKHIAEFCKLSMEESINIGNLQQSKTHIFLRLNPEAKDNNGLVKHEFDYKIMNIVADIFNKLQLNDRNGINILVNNLECFAQKLLKQEWEKSKKEATSGKSASTYESE